MKAISKREYQVLALYSRGLTFKEIGNALNIAHRTAINYYMRVKVKDQSRIVRAKRSRAYNKSEFSKMLAEVIKEVKAHNKVMMQYTFMNKYIISIKDKGMSERINYINESLLFAYKSFNRWKVNLTKKRNAKVNS